MIAFRSLFVGLLATVASAARLTVSIPSSQLLPNPSTLPPTTHAVLIGPPGSSKSRYDVPLRRDNTFVFAELPEASYLLQIHTRDLFFPPLRIDVVKTHDELGAVTMVQAWQTFRGNEWSNRGPAYGSSKEELTISVAPNGHRDFYQSRGGFNIINFLKSPMILMGLFSVVMIFGVPYLMDNMDPEAKAEFEEMQKNSPLTGGSGAASQIQNFDLAGFLAGKSSSTDSGSGSKRR